MGFNFPSSPTSGQTYEPVGGPVFVWDGTAWKSRTTGTPVTVHVGDNPPPNPALGQLWWDSDSGNLFIWYADGDSAQWVQVSGMPKTEPPTALAKNRIVNGAMQISQENGTAAVATNLGYPADQWRLAFTGTGITPSTTLTKVSTPALIAPAYIYFSSYNSAKPSLAATDRCGLDQLIEGVRLADFGWGTATALPVVVRFVAWASPAGTYGLSIRNGDGTRSYVVPMPLTTTPTAYNFAIPGCTDGVWANDTASGMILSFNAAAGTGFLTATPNQWVAANMLGPTGMSNLLSANNQIVRFAQVGLYLDPDNTGLAPKWQMPDEAEELRACQRHYQKSAGLGLRGLLGATLVNSRYYQWFLPVTMRASPAFSGTSSGTGLTANTTPDMVSAYTTDGNVTNLYQLSSAVLNARM
jgi:hypothetical protein